MRKKIAVLFTLISLCGFPFGLGADDIETGQAINRVPLTGRDKLARLLSKADVRLEDKARAIERLAELTKDLPANRNVEPKELYNPILGVLSGNRGHKVLRKVACQSLVAFARLKGSDKLVEPLGKIVGNSGDFYEVRRAAAVTLGRFANNTGSATDQLVRALDAELKRGPRGDNVTFTKIVIDSIGRLQNKRSFVPLMRVIQSDFPTATKRAAQRALENIRWE